MAASLQTAAPLLGLPVLTTSAAAAVQRSQYAALTSLSGINLFRWGGELAWEMGMLCLFEQSCDCKQTACFRHPEGLSAGASCNRSMHQLAQPVAPSSFPAARGCWPTLPPSLSTASSRAAAAAPAAWPSAWTHTPALAAAQQRRQWGSGPAGDGST